MVWRLAADGTWQWVEATTACELLDSTVKMGETKTYRVQSMRYADGTWENGPVSATAEAQMLPVAPVNLIASPGSGNRAIRLDWQGAGNADLFGILRVTAKMVRIPGSVPLRTAALRIWIWKAERRITIRFMQQSAVTAYGITENHPRL